MQNSWLPITIRVCLSVSNAWRDVWAVSAHLLNHKDWQWKKYLYLRLGCALPTTTIWMWVDLKLLKTAQPSKMSHSFSNKLPSCSPAHQLVKSKVFQDSRIQLRQFRLIKINGTIRWITLVSVGKAQLYSLITIPTSRQSVWIRTKRRFYRSQTPMDIQSLIDSKIISAMATSGKALCRLSEWTVVVWLKTTETHWSWLLTSSLI